ncbi:hypothetical protein HUJ04_009064 [Dendroctonus ponderosae]|uniref:Palmitoyltransferase n=1 Tax=Dendroctonus ponderosae TaxID=77166 RepID=A0AAR5PIB6_DENPD|nr:hypothetical protein HUJ04_009064 [Dendroctonus ponderosae]
MCFGVFKRLCHLGPLTALGIIKFVTGMTMYCSGMWWPSSTTGGFVNTMFFMAWSGLTFYNLLSAMFHGPGYLSLNWTPENPDDCKYLQKCAICHGYKAPRSHHCRKCGRCVQKKDHHCPWINNCVGWGNHAHFTYFLFYATLGCIHASIVLACAMYRALYRNYYLVNHIRNVPIVNLGLMGLGLTVLALGFALGVVVAVGMLLVIQVRVILSNQTAVEDWILEKANSRRKARNQEPFVYPYDLGWRKNVAQVVSLNGQPIGDGIHWPVRDGCTQYSLTIEQLKQKEEKQLRACHYQIIKPFSGYWFPIVFGLKVCYGFPCTDEPRLKLDIGDVIRVTRWRKHWLFGEKLQPDLTEEQQVVFRQRGWFPRPCGVLVDTEDEFSMPDRSRSTMKKNK